jgi:hypothetical protein
VIGGERAAGAGRLLSCDHNNVPAGLVPVRALNKEDTMLLFFVFKSLVFFDQSVKYP